MTSLASRDASSRGAGVYLSSLLYERAMVIVASRCLSLKARRTRVSDIIVMLSVLQNHNLNICLLFSYNTWVTPTLTRSNFPIWMLLLFGQIILQSFHKSLKPDYITRGRKYPLGFRSSLVVKTTNYVLC